MAGRYGGNIGKVAKPAAKTLPPQVPAMELLGRVVKALDRMTAPPSKRNREEPRDEPKRQETTA